MWDKLSAWLRPFVETLVRAGVEANPVKRKVQGAGTMSIDDAIADATCKLLFAWLICLSATAGLTWSGSLAELDDAMLPPLRGAFRQSFDVCILNSAICEFDHRGRIDIIATHQLARAILRQARLSLPAGQVIPDEVRAELEQLVEPAGFKITP